MKSLIFNRLPYLVIGLVGMTLATGKVEAKTDVNCTELVFVDLYSSIQTPVKTYLVKSFDNVPYSLITASGSNDQGPAIAVREQQRNSVPGMLIPQGLKNQLIATYNSEIASLKKQEADLADDACVASIKSQRAAAKAAIPAPHQFQFFGRIWSGERLLYGKLDK